MIEPPEFVLFASWCQKGKFKANEMGNHEMSKRGHSGDLVWMGQNIERNRMIACGLEISSSGYG
jgi:hypothetical protein